MDELAYLAAISGITTIIDSPIIRKLENVGPKVDEIQEIQQKVDILSTSNLTCDFGITAILKNYENDE